MALDYKPNGKEANKEISKINSNCTNFDNLKARVTSELARIDAEKKAKEEAKKSENKKNNYNDFSKLSMIKQEDTFIIYE